MTDIGIFTTRSACINVAMRGRQISAFIVFLLITSSIGRGESWEEWFVRMSGLNRIKNIAQPRDHSQTLSRDLGSEIRVYDLSSKAERKCTTCNGAWSLVSMDHNNIAYLATDGLWMVSVNGGPSTLITIDKSLTDLIGTTKQGDILALSCDPRSIGNAAARYVVKRVNPATGVVSAIDDSPSIALDVEGRLDLLKFKTFRNDQQLAAGGIPKRIMKANLSAGAERLSFDYLETLQDTPDTSSRFEPIWIDDSHIIYLAATLPI
jgi:hypothetical protein